MTWELPWLDGVKKACLDSWGLWVDKTWNVEFLTHEATETRSVVELEVMWDDMVGVFSELVLECLVVDHFAAVLFLQRLSIMSLVCVLRRPCQMEGP